MKAVTCGFVVTRQPTPAFQSTVSDVLTASQLAPQVSCSPNEDALTYGQITQSLTQPSGLSGQNCSHPLNAIVVPQF